MGAMLDIGATLREARERRHLTQAEVEASTMIPARYLDALEHERYERLPAGLYRRSFLREYADYLGLNGDLYVVEYDLETAPAEPPEPLPGPRPLRDAVAANAARVGGAALAVAAALAGLWWLGGEGGSSPGPVRVTTSAPAPAPAVPRAAPPAHTVRRAPPVLRLVAAGGDCWLSVRAGSAAGRVVYEGTLRRGSSVVFGLRRRLVIRLGAPEHLTATLGGRPVTTLPTQTADVVVTAAGITQGR